MLVVAVVATLLFVIDIVCLYATQWSQYSNSVILFISQKHYVFVLQNVKISAQFQHTVVFFNIDCNYLFTHTDVGHHVL